MKISLKEHFYNLRHGKWYFCTSFDVSYGFHCQYYDGWNYSLNLGIINIECHY